MALQNSWVRYFDRSYQQLKDRVLTDLGTLVPEITDHTESNPFVRLLSIWSGIAEMLGYYIDNAGRETHLATCRLYWSGIKIANSYDYRVHCMIPATGTLKLTLNAPAPSDITIAIGSIFSDDDGVQFITIEAGEILTGADEVTINVKQMTFVNTTPLGVSDGTTDQQFSLPINVADNSVTVTINAIGWQLQETLAYSVASDTHYKQTVATNKVPVIAFGDGFNGLIPTAGQTVEATYYSTVGSAGNLPAGSITTIVSNLGLPVGVTATVTNEYATVGGSEIETLDSIKLRVPKQVRTNDRAVTIQDFKDVTELKTGVARAGVSYECGKKVEIFIVPDGGGVASPALLSDTFDWLEDRKMLTEQVVVKSAGEVHILLGINLTVLPQYQRLLVEAAVRDALEEYLSYLNQEISGTVHLSDIYQIIETTEGVSHSQITSMKPTPYAKPEGATVAVLDWDPVLTNQSVSVQHWTIRMMSANTFELSKGSAYIGTFNTGVLISQTEINFTVNGAYTLNDQWTFVTYPSFGTVVLDEPSIPVSSGADIVINSTGGL